MGTYLLISSRDSFECADAENVYRTAIELKAAGRDVTLFLVQNGVLPAREGSDNRALLEVVRAGVPVLADEFSLRERAVTTKRLVPGVRPAPLECVVDALAAGARTIWH